MVMACRDPYLKAPGGADTKGFINSKEVRTAVTPFPCGNCLPCRINHSEIWKHRLMLEALDHDHNCFATLTYEDHHLTLDDHGTPQLNENELTLFLKKFRKHCKFRYFAVGEYGELSRPHYHIMFFGIPPKMESLMEKVWGMGFVKAYECNHATCRYIVGYCVKKLTKEGDELLYGKKPEFMRSSRGTKSNGLGGLGRNTIRRIAEDFKKQPYFKPRVINQLRIGKKLYPIGRYLTKKLSDDLGVEPVQWEEYVRNYQNECFTKYTCEQKSYKEKVLELGEGKSNSIECKFKFFKPQRSL
jgi:hypothetical protein